MANNTLDACFSQKTYNWGTPKDLFDQLNGEYHFRIDPCTWPNNPLGLEFFYTEEQNGLTKDWPYNAYINPPYGRGTRAFVEKAISESKKWGTTNVMLLPARTDTKVFHELLYEKPNITLKFVRGRIKFEGVSADFKRNSAPFPSMIVIIKHPKPLKCADLEQDFGITP